MRILVPIDFSDCSVNALLYAVQLGSAMEAKLLVFHAFHAIAEREGSFFRDEKLIAEEERRAERKLTKLIALIPELQKIPHQCLVRHTLAADGVADIVRKHTVDMVIMGTLGASEIDNILFGSVTSSVIQRVECPVIAIPPDYREFSLKSAILATDFGLYRKQDHWDIFCTLLKIFGTKLQILHIQASEKEEKYPDAQKITAALPHIPYSIQYLYDKDTEHGMLHFLQQNPSDLLTVISRKHSWLELLFRKSITRQLALHTRIPLLVLH